MSSSSTFGELIRTKRMALAEKDSAFSVRQVAQRVGIEPSYLSKIERDEQAPPGEENIRRLAEELGENPDALLALAGKVSSDLLDIIRERPTVVADLLRAVRRMSAKRVTEISRQIRDGDW
jgi:transcriptional regulator with XRE-family HTH domain